MYAINGVMIHIWCVPYVKVLTGTRFLCDFHYVLIQFLCETFTGTDSRLVFALGGSTDTRVCALCGRTDARFVFSLGGFTDTSLVCAFTSGSCYTFVVSLRCAY